MLASSQASLWSWSQLAVGACGVNGTFSAKVLGCAGVAGADGAGAGELPRAGWYGTEPVMETDRGLGKASLILGGCWVFSIWKIAAVASRVAIIQVK